MANSRKRRLDDIRNEHLANAVTYEKESGDIGPFYGLPARVKNLLFDQRGIHNVYDWQHECLSMSAVKERHNLIYSLPTSGGKTLVAEILILKQLLCYHKDALLILPFVSIVQEKVRNLSTLAVELDFLVEEYAGSKGCIPPKKRLSRKSLYVATIEKASGLVNSLIQENRIMDIGLVVVDELHMLGEGGSRGAILESTLTRLMASSDVQLVGMSATLSNISDLQKFLSAEVYTNNFRPVQLTEFVKIEDNIYELNHHKAESEFIQHARFVTYPYTKNLAKLDPDHILGLVSEVVPDNSCLVFCPTKKHCENLALLITKYMPRHLCEIKKDERLGLIKQISSDADICPILKRTILFGVAYHHSGLTSDERKLIEEAYSSGILYLLMCTSTLAAGVNLPAKRVIVRSAYIGANVMTRSQYKQMIGRAGRAGIDASGESVLILNKMEKQKVLDIISGPYDSCKSSLMHDSGKGVRQLVLTAIGLGITTDTHSLRKFMQRTLLAIQGQDLSLVVMDTLQTLTDLGLVINVQDKLSIKHLGRACFKGSIDVDQASQLYSDLCAGQKSLVVDNYLHLLYLVTPYDMVNQVKPSWMIYCQEMSSFEPSELNVCEIVGVSESFIVRKAAGQAIRQPPDLLVVNRFYLTLMLHGLWKQNSVWSVAERFQVTRGFVQNLLSSAAAFAFCVTHFCQELEEFWAYRNLLPEFGKKLAYCVTAELIPLMEIPGVKQGRARQLYSAGYKTLQHLAHADVEEMIRSVEHLPRKTATMIVNSAKMLLTEMAESLQKEAVDIIAAPSPKRLKT